MTLELRFALGAVAFSAALSAAPVCAHQGVGYNLRAIHVAHDTQGATLYMRLTLPLVVAGELGSRREDGSYDPAPFTYNRIESGKVYHYLDFTQLQNRGEELGRKIAAGHELFVDKAALTPEVIALRVHVKGAVPVFDQLEDAREAVRGPLMPLRQDEIDSGYVLVDVALRYVHNGGVSRYALRSTLVPGELGESTTRNVIWDHRGATTDVYEVRGLLNEAWVIDPVAETSRESKRD